MALDNFKHPFNAPQFCAWMKRAGLNSGQVADQLCVPLADVTVARIYNPAAAKLFPLVCTLGIDPEAPTLPDDKILVGLICETIRRLNAAAPRRGRRRKAA